MAAAASMSENRLCCLFTRIKTTLHYWQTKEHRETDRSCKLQNFFFFFFFVLTGILDLDGGVGLRMGLVNHLSADLLRQNLHRETDRDTRTKDEWPLVKCPGDHNAEQD